MKSALVVFLTVSASAFAGALLALFDPGAPASSLSATLISLWEMLINLARSWFHTWPQAF
ncbi:MAG: hypothetical protein ACNA7E_01225 [Wenzhouxiangellaceae bacterium]